MGMILQYDSNQPAGQQYTITCGREQAVTAIMGEGLTELDASKLIQRAHTEARAAGRSTPIRIPRAKSKLVELDGEVVAEFIGERFRPQAGSRILFSDFYREFITWLEPSFRSLWNRVRVSRALPDYHGTVAGSGNVRFVKDLTKHPA